MEFNDVCFDVGEVSREANLRLGKKGSLSADDSVLQVRHCLGNSVEGRGRFKLELGCLELLLICVGHVHKILVSPIRVVQLVEPQSLACTPDGPALIGHMAPFIRLL